MSFGKIVLQAIQWLISRLDLFKIAWRSIQHRKVASILTTISMALGVMMVVIVLSIHGVVQTSFENNASLGYNMIVGPKGGKLQLTLNTVYYLSQPVENISYEAYMEFLDADERKTEYRYALFPPNTPIEDGQYGKAVTVVIPVCLGDYFGRFRVVGTTSDLFSLVFDYETGRKLEFADGRAFERFNADHGWFECVVGSSVAREMNVKVGDRISPSHGAPTDEGGETHERKFTVVGVMKPSGTPHDRALFVNMEGFYLMSNHAKDLPEELEAELANRDPDAPRQPALADEDYGEWGPPLPVEQREVTALLVSAEHILSAMRMHDTINEGMVAQAVYPAEQVTSLFNIFVRPIQFVLLALTAMICVVSGVSILVSIYNSMSDRKKEIAVMRALGASRGTVMEIILLESTILSLAGGIFGWLLGHTVNQCASGQIERRTGVSMGFFDFAPSINLLEVFGSEPIIEGLELSCSPEFLLIPALIVLAIIVGFWPALSAYRTDVAESLGP